MTLKRFLFLVFLFSSLVINENSYSQYKGNSDFLYGKWKSRVPYYISLQAGVASSQTFFNKDFINEGGEFSWGIAFEKPLGYRPSLNFNFRSMGRYEQSFLGNKINLNDPELLSNSEISSKVTKSYDLTLNISYMFFEHRSWQSRLSGGLGFIQSSIRTKDSITQVRSNTSTVIPIQLSTGRSLFGRWEIEFAYRYYLAINDELDGYSLHNNLDKYSYAYIGIKYMFGQKDHRFQKKDSCPSVK